MSRLGLRLGAAFALVVAVAITVMTTRHVRTIRAVHAGRLRAEAGEKLQAIRGEFEAEAARILARLKPLAEVRELAFRVQPGGAPVPGSGPAVDSAAAADAASPGPIDPVGLQRFLEEALPVTGLDSLEAASLRGEVLARAQFSESVGEARADSMVAAAAGGAEAVTIRRERFADEDRLSLVAAVPVRARLRGAGGARGDTGVAAVAVAVLSGGVRLDRLAGRLGGLARAVVRLEAEGQAVASETPPAAAAASGLVGGDAGGAPWWAETRAVEAGAGVRGTLSIWIPAGEIVAAEEALVADTVRAGAVAIVAAAAVGLLLGIGPTRRLRLLTDAAVQIGRGDLDAPVRTEGADEIGLLGRTLARTAAALKTERERLARSERVAAWRDAARRLAHELKNAITPIHLSLRTALRAVEKGEAGRDAARESLDAVGGEIEQLRGLVEEFSRFARLPEAALAPYDVGKALRAAATLHGARAAIRLDLAEALPAAAADEELMGRVWANVVGNAVEAAGAGGAVRLRAFLDVAEGADLVAVEVEDSGPGLPEERLRGGAAEGASAKPGGWGIGLALVERIVAEHNGTLRLENRPDGGARVTVRLPVWR